MLKRFLQSSALRKPLPPTTRQRLVVIGHGMVAHRLCQNLASDGPSEHFDVVVIGEEPHPAYDRIRLSESPSPDIGTLHLADPAWYANHNIELHTGIPVESVSLDDSQVILKGGSQIHYDKLVFATGSVPQIPPIDGLRAGHRVQVLRTYEDLERLRQKAITGKIGAIIGGGLLGLETAKVLNDLGVSAHVIEASSYLMPRQLDAESADILRKRIESLGVHLHLGSRTLRVSQSKYGTSIEFDGKHPALECDFIVVAAGTSPRDELAREAGIEVGGRGGIIIDEGMATSARGVYALGECVSFKGQRIGLVSPGYAMADALAEILCGKSARFAKVDKSCQLKLLGVPVSAGGLYDVDIHQVSVKVDGGRRTLMLDGKRLVGVTAVGDWPDFGRTLHLANRRARLTRSQLELFETIGELWPQDGNAQVRSWPPSTVVCNCQGITRGELSACIAEGCRDVVSLGKATGAGTTCGSCVGLLGQLCDTREVQPLMPGRHVLLLSSLAAITLTVVFCIAGPIPISESVQQAEREIDALFRDETLKRWTGYCTVGVTVLGLVVSGRKRLRWFRWGAFGHYRGWHALAGTLAMLGLVAHTGLRFGSNLNMTLMVMFTAACALGALTGIAAAMESTTVPAIARRGRRWRRPLNWLHLFLFWQLPVLIGVHVFSVYYF